MVKAPFRSDVYSLFLSYQGALQKELRKKTNINFTILRLLRLDPTFYRQNEKMIQDLLSRELNSIRGVANDSEEDKDTENNKTKP